MNTNRNPKTEHVISFGIMYSNSEQNNFHDMLAIILDLPNGAKWFRLTGGKINHSLGFKEGTPWKVLVVTIIVF